MNQIKSKLSKIYNNYFSYKLFIVILVKYINNYKDFFDEDFNVAYELKNAA